MLTLSSISQRIEALETEEYSSVNERLSVWYSMVSWKFFEAQYASFEEAKKVLYSLPNDHPMRIAVGKLTWFMCYFVSALPDVTWKSEKAELCFAAWLEEAIAEGFTESALCSEEAMTDAIQFCATCLTNGSMDFFDELKKQEQENWQKKLEYRRLANFGELSEEAKEWLQVNDTAFWQNFTAKVESKPVEVKPLPIALPPALPEAIPPQEIIQPVANGPVRLKYLGGWRGFRIATVDGIKSIEPGDTVTVPNFVWANIQSGVMPKSWWVKL